MWSATVHITTEQHKTTTEHNIYVYNFIHNKCNSEIRRKQTNKLTYIYICTLYTVTHKKQPLRLFVVVVKSASVLTKNAADGNQLMHFKAV